MSGGLLVAAFPAPDASALAWVALLPLFLVTRRESAAHAAAAGLATGLVFQSALGWWLLPAGVHPAGYLLGAVGCALFPAGFAAAAAGLHRRAPGWSGLTFPALWVLSEYARMHVGFGATPWGLLGYSQLEFALAARIAAVAGVLGISFVVVAANASLAWAMDRTRAGAGGALAAGLALAVTLGLSCAGMGSWGGPTGRTLRVAVIQGGSSDGLSADSDSAARLVARYRELTRASVAQGAALVVWPESSLPTALPSDREALSNLARLARELRVHLVVSTTGRDKRAPSLATRRANSAFVFGPTGRVAGRYDKMRLLPFIEYLPLRGLVAWPSWIAPAMVDAVAGDSQTVFDADGARFAVQLCWENLFPSASANGLDFVVSMTNEAFTAESAGRRQLYQINAMRAIESGLPLVRAATTGVSAIVSPSGAELAHVRDAEGRDLDAIGFAVAEIPLGGAPSPYARFGDWLVGAAGVGVVSAALLAKRGKSGVAS